MFGWLIATLPFSILLGTGTGEGHTHRQQGQNVVDYDTDSDIELRVPMYHSYTRGSQMSLL